MLLQQALEKGLWFLLNDNQSILVVISSITCFIQTVLEKTKLTRDDIFGEADDVEIKEDKRIFAIKEKLQSLQSADLWEKQFILLYCMWQFPGLLKMISSHSSRNVALFLENDFKNVMVECICGTSITPDQKGAKTVIVAHARSPLETVCYVVKLLQLAHYHNNPDS